MGIFSELGKLAGIIVGGVVGGTTELVGEIVDSNFIREVGQGVNRASVNAGNTVGQAADGVAGIAKGIITQDSYAREEGVENLGDAVGRTAIGMAKGVGNIAKSGFNTIEGVIEGDKDKAIKGAKNLAKVVAISTLAIGVGDYIGIIGDDIDDVADTSELADLSDTVDIYDDGIADIVDENIEYGIAEVETSEVHQVQPHYVKSHMRGDNFIEGYWRDGDGNTNINLTEEQGGGYVRSNPDNSTINNLD